jgi:hypothetical protein
MTSKSELSGLPVDVLRCCTLPLCVDLQYSSGPNYHEHSTRFATAAHVCPAACRWREFRGMRNDFTLLDRNGGAGFDLASKLLSTRNSLNRWGSASVLWQLVWGALSASGSSDVFIPTAVVLWIVSSVQG